jgi:hypothetical protein
MRSADCGINDRTSWIKERGMKIDEYKNMTSKKQNYLRERTKTFALQIIKMVEHLPKGRTAEVLGRQ